MTCTYAAARPPRPRFKVELGLNPVLPLRTACCKYFSVIDSENIFSGSQSIYILNVLVKRYILTKMFNP